MLFDQIITELTMSNWLSPITDELKKFSLSQQLSQQQIIYSLTQTNSLLQEQNQLLQKLLDKKQ